MPDNVDYKYLHEFKKFILKLSKKYKIVIVTGGGKTARRYIEPLMRESADQYAVSLVGIMATKLNARLVSGILDIKEQIPDSLIEVKKTLEKKEIVVCGALGVQPNMTSDGDAAEIGEYLKAKYFFNLTNVNGLYEKDPKKFKKTKIINKISYKDFMEKVNKIKYEAGQHFVLDQAAAKIINRSKIKTIIINGNKIDNVNKFLENKKFIGTIIE